MTLEEGRVRSTLLTILEKRQRRYLRWTCGLSLALSLDSWATEGHRTMMTPHLRGEARAGTVRVDAFHRDRGIGARKMQIWRRFLRVPTALRWNRGNTKMAKALRAKKKRHQVMSVLPRKVRGCLTLLKTTTCSVDPSEDHD